MAPVPAGTWHEEMTDELYASLLGGVGRAVAEGEGVEERREVGAEEIMSGAARDGLRIFG